MFGYVKEYAPELKVKDYSLYKAVYCGLCKSMGKCCGSCSRLTLSYDITFLAIVRMALEHTEYELTKDRCIAHPFKKRPMMKSNSVLDYSARASVILSYEKLRDDIKDSKGFKKLCYTLLLPFLSYGKRRSDLPELSEKISAKLKELDSVEQSAEKSVDIPAGIFGELTAQVFACGLDGAERKIAENIGFYTGKWIYAVDALDDMEKDVKSGSYNPFVLLYGENIPLESKEMIKSAFVHYLAEIEKAADLIDFTDASLKELIFNIIYEGMKRKSDSITDRAFDKLKKESDN